MGKEYSYPHVWAHFLGLTFVIGCGLWGIMYLLEFIQNIENYDTAYPAVIVNKTQETVTSVQQQDVTVTGEKVLAKNGSAAQAAINYARSKLGKRYVWGAEGPNTFDCSGLSWAAWAKGAGKKLVRGICSYYWNHWKRIPKGSLVPPGAIALFYYPGRNGKKSIDHCAVVEVGAVDWKDVEIIEATGSRGKVIRTTFKKGKSVYGGKYRADLAGRILGFVYPP